MSNRSEHLQHLINGQWTDGVGPLVPNVNPADPERILTTSRAFPSDRVADVAAGAAAAFQHWSTRPIAERAAVLTSAAALIDERYELLAAALSAEEGKPLAEAGAEVSRAAEYFRYFAGWAQRASGEIFPSPRPDEQIHLARHPRGVVLAITPFNFPLAIPAWKIAPALVFGNTVVWKPASSVPHCAVLLTRCLHDAGLPAGVLSLVLGEGVIGQRLAGHELVAAVTFTGSTRVGRALIEQCGRTATPVQAEMGGKNATVVLADADLDLASRGIFDAAFSSSGQKCTATSRLVVDRSVAEPLLAKLNQLVQTLRPGDPLDPATTLGPLIDQASAQRAHRAVEQALAGGARSRASSPATPTPPGWFVPAQIIEVESVNDPLWREELFAPVLAVLRSDNPVQAFGFAGHGKFGLAGALYTNNLATALTADRHWRVGTLHVNSASTGNDPYISFGGVGASGFGAREQGEAARSFYTEERTVYLHGR